MSKKFSAQRKRAFLTYLAETGNQTLSAERAKVSRSWVQLHRSTDAEFDGACRRAIEEARERLRQTPDQVRGDEQAGSLPASWKYHNGAELVVEAVVAGTGGAGGGKRVQVRRARLKQWTPRVEQRFLAALAATCNVKAACTEVGMWPPSAYNHRNRWPAFARAWDEAIEAGYVRLEAELVEAGCNLFSSLGMQSEEGRLTGMSAGDAIHVLHMHKHQVRGAGKRPGLRERVATPEEAERELAKGLRRLNSWMKRQALRQAQDERERP